MRKYKTVSKEVVAEQLTADNAEELAAWCNGTIVIETNPMDVNQQFKGINYPTLYGNRRVSETQFLVKDEEGFKTIGAIEFTQQFVDAGDDEAPVDTFDPTLIPNDEPLSDEGDLAPVEENQSGFDAVFEPRQI